MWCRRMNSHYIHSRASRHDQMSLETLVYQTRCCLYPEWTELCWLTAQFICLEICIWDDLIASLASKPQVLCYNHQACADILGTVGHPNIIRCLWLNIWNEPLAFTAKRVISKPFLAYSYTHFFLDKLD